jgi:hypothetical protein
MKKRSNLSWILVFMLLASMPVHATDFVLEIYGNANMDEFLNKEDIQYIENIIAGTKNPTMLADANFDGKVERKYAYTSSVDSGGNRVYVSDVWFNGLGISDYWDAVGYDNEDMSSPRKL